MNNTTIGAILLVLGAFLFTGGKVSWIGHLPGDLWFGGQRCRICIPIATCVVVSFVWSLISKVLGNR